MGSQWENRGMSPLRSRSTRRRHICETTVFFRCFSPLGGPHLPPPPRSLSWSSIRSSRGPAVRRLLGSLSVGSLGGLAAEVFCSVVAEIPVPRQLYSKVDA